VSFGITAKFIFVAFYETIFQFLNVRNQIDALKVIFILNMPFAIGNVFPISVSALFSKINKRLL
jgi:hypothetical protein